MDLSTNPAIVKDEIMIPMENGTEMEWRHIILMGNNTQIGMALGEVAQKEYGLKYSKVAPKDLPVEPTMIPSNHPYDTFNRYRTPYNITSNHQGRFSEQDIADAIFNVSVNSILEYQGAVKPLPMTTPYDSFIDLTNRSMALKCFLRAGPVDKEMDMRYTIFTPYLTFKIDNPVKRSQLKGEFVKEN